MKDFYRCLAFGFLVLSYPSKLLAEIQSISQKSVSIEKVYELNASCVDFSGVWEGLCGYPGELDVPKTPSNVTIEQTGCSEFIIDSIAFNVGVPVNTSSQIDADGYKIEIHRRVNWLFEDQTKLQEMTSITSTPPPESGIKSVTRDTFENSYKFRGERLSVVRTPLRGNFNSLYCSYDKK
jgi:hypothetical protein